MQSIKDYGTTPAHYGAREAELNFLELWTETSSAKWDWAEFDARYSVVDAVVYDGKSIDHLLEIKRRHVPMSRDEKPFIEAQKYDNLMLLSKLMKVPVVVAWVYDDGIKYLVVNTSTVTGTGRVRSRKSGDTNNVVYLNTADWIGIPDDDFSLYFKEPVESAG